MKALLVFGPAHGKAMDVVFNLAAPPDLMIPTEERPSFAKVPEGAPPSAFGARIMCCRYTLLDVLSDDRTGEDCALYAHHPACLCHDKTLETQDRSGNGQFYDRYKDGLQASQALANYYPQVTFDWDGWQGLGKWTS